MKKKRTFEMIGILAGGQGPKGFQLMMWDDEAQARDWFDYLHVDRDLSRAQKVKLGPVHRAHRYLVVPLEDMKWKRTGKVVIPCRRSKKKR